MLKFRLFLAWLYVIPAFIIYYIAAFILIVMLFLLCGGFRLLLGPNSDISNCVFWSGWKWISEAWIHRHDNHHKKGVGPGGYLVIRWSAWFRGIPFLHIGWLADSDEIESFVPEKHNKRVFPPPLFRGKSSLGS